MYVPTHVRTLSDKTGTVHLSSETRGLRAYCGQLMDRDSRQLGHLTKGAALAPLLQQITCGRCRRTIAFSVTNVRAGNAASTGS